MSEVIQIVTTTDQLEAANHIARTLVEERLAACVQVVGPITSHYRWREALEESQEFQCVAKTRAELFDAVARRIAELHSYDEPEIIALPVLNGSAGYLTWVRDETRCDTQ